MPDLTVPPFCGRPSKDLLSQLKQAIAITLARFK
jgi:hypothetical protein